MKKIIVAICAVGFSFVAMADFVPGTEDIPAMTDMSFSEDVVSFDAPEGQILNIVGTTKATAEQIKQFYITGLTPLGWQYKGNNRFVRSKDSLELEIVPDGKLNSVRFSLTVSND